MGGEEGAVCSVVKFPSIIGLKGLDGTSELRLNISIEEREKMMNFRFVANGKCPSKMCKIIKDYKIILKTRHT
jgi:hypothetical protein